MAADITGGKEAKISKNGQKWCSPAKTVCLYFLSSGVYVYYDTMALKSL